MMFDRLVKLTGQSQTLRFLKQRFIILKQANRTRQLSHNTKHLTTDKENRKMEKIKIWKLVSENAWNFKNLHCPSFIW